MKSMSRAVLLAAGMLAGAASASYAADAVTFNEHVAPIFQANCVSCHRPAGQNIGSLVAPMSLMTFEEARPWARSIALKVKGREMPPWFADGPKGVFSNERGLTDKEIETIVAWVNGGSQAGDKSKAPPPVQFADAGQDGYSLGKPDLIVKMPPYVLTDEAQDVQGVFTVQLTEDLLPNDVTLRAWEFRAGTYLPGQDTVHHMCGGVIEPGEAPITPAEMGDGKGAASLGLGCIAGGAEPQQLPEGFGRQLKKGSTILFNMHYYKQPGAGSGYTNQAEIGFYFAKGPDRAQGPHEGDWHVRFRDSAAEGQPPRRSRRNPRERHLRARVLAACAPAGDRGALCRGLSRRAEGSAARRPALRPELAGHVQAS